MFFIKITWVLSIFMFAVVFVFADDILKFLYGNGLGRSVIDELLIATRMLQFASISIVYYAFLHTFTAILQSIGRSYVPLIAMIIGVVVRIALTIVFVGNPNVNIFGAILANIISLSITVILLSIYIKKKIDLEYHFFKELIVPAIIVGVDFFVMCVVKIGLNVMLNYFVSMLISLSVGLIIFVIWVYNSRIFTRNEKKEFFKNRHKKFKSRDLTVAVGQKNP